MQNPEIKMHLPKIHFLVVLLSLFFSSFGFAQKDGIISGKILDKVTGETLIGATINVNGTSDGVITDIEGNYTIHIAPGSYVLNIMYVGMQAAKASVEVKAGEITNLDYAMEVAQETSLHE